MIEENTFNKKNIIESKTYYDSGTLKEIIHFNKSKIVGVHEFYSRDGEISKFEIYDLMGYLTFSYERGLGSYKMNGIRYNDTGEKDE